MIPQGGNTTFSKAEDTNDINTYLFDYDQGDFVRQDGKLVELTGEEAIKSWIEKVLRTSKTESRIYKGETYGTTYRDLIMGSSFPKDFIDSEVKRDITEALLEHPAIQDVDNFELLYDEDVIKIRFKVNKRMEVNYDL